MENRLFVLDTSVLIHDPESIRSFRNTSVAIPIYVIMELDDLKESKRMDVATSARIVSRRISDIMKLGSLHDPKGVLDPNTNSTFYVIGASREDGGFDGLLSGIGTRKTDLLILKTALRKKQEGFNVVVVTKDVNMRILADSEGLEAEDYDQDKVSPEAVPSGLVTIPFDSAAQCAYQNPLDPSVLGCEGVAFNEFVLCGDHLLRLHGDGLLHPVPKSFKNLAIQPRNLEQRMALDLLSDPEVKLVNLIGLAGTGKTLCALAVAINGLDFAYSKVILSKPVVPMGRELGFLPGPQPLDALVLTPTGWVKMGDIRVGSDVISRDGKPTKVIGVFPKGKKTVYRITTTEGTATEACIDHLWHTQTAEERKRGKAGKTRGTGEILQSLLTPRGKPNHFLPRVEPVEFQSGDKLLVPPYLMGVLLGDGSISNCIGVSSMDSDILDRVAKEVSVIGCTLVPPKGNDSIQYFIRGNVDYNKPARPVLRTNIEDGSEEKFDSVGKASHALGINRGTLSNRCENERTVGGWHYKFLPCPVRWQHPLKEALHGYGLDGSVSTTKFIPDAYKYASIPDRVDLLRGLLDTDGCVNKRSGEVSFYTTSEQLAKDVIDVVRSLGGRATSRKRDPRERTSYIKGREIRSKHISYELSLHLPDGITPFHLQRKASLCNAHSYMHGIGITSIEAVGEKEVQCILVENPEHLYVTDDYLVTHNTEEEKMAPWMLSYVDNMDQIFKPDNDVKGRRGTKEKTWEQLLHSKKLEIQPLHSIRGRSIGNAFIIADEIQNCTPHEVKTFVSRAAEGTKVVLCGDPSQIDDSYLDAFTNGLVHSAVNSKGSKIAGTVILRQGVRSELAEFAATRL